MNIPERGPNEGLQYEWDFGFEIALEVVESEVVLRGNRAGLISLARHLLTLAQEDVSPGTHLHLAAGQEIDSAFGLILESMGP
ncbi:hypothetical protein [Umezawaea sp. NPDC059074]|uniref:Imm32 family immunity protein n=1 Tax=Umezawaea sp. NPDC059074 TaxID=3346716 RepID=UPI00367B92E5